MSENLGNFLVDLACDPALWRSSSATRHGAGRTSLDERERALVMAPIPASFQKPWEHELLVGRSSRFQRRYAHRHAEEAPAGRRRPLRRGRRAQDTAKKTRFASGRRERRQPGSSRRKTR